MPRTLHPHDIIYGIHKKRTKFSKSSPYPPLIWAKTSINSILRGWLLVSTPFKHLHWNIWSVSSLAPDCSSTFPISNQHSWMLEIRCPRHSPAQAAWLELMCEGCQLRSNSRVSISGECQVLVAGKFPCWIAGVGWYVWTWSKLGHHNGWKTYYENIYMIIFV